MTTIAVLLGLMLLVAVGYKMYGAVLRSRADYLLDYFDGNRGRGFVVVRKSDGQRLKWQRIPESSGLKIFRVAGVSRRPEALDSKKFRLTREVRLIPEPENPVDPDAIGVYDSDGETHLGYVPSEDVQEVREMMEADPEYATMVIWENLEDGERVGIRIMLAAGDVALATT